MEQWYPLSEQKTVFNSEVPQELELRIREDYGLNADIEALYVKYGESVVSAVIKNTRKNVLDSELKTELRRITNNGRDVRPVQDVMKELDKKDQFRNVPTSRVQRIMNEEVEQNGIEDSPEEYVEEMIAEGASRSIIVGHLVDDFGLGETGAGLMYQKALRTKGKKNEEVEQNAQPSRARLVASAKRMLTEDGPEDVIRILRDNEGVPSQEARAIVAEVMGKKNGVVEQKQNENIDGYNVRLEDDGSMDTVVSVNGRPIRFGDTSHFRDSKGNITRSGWKSLAEEAIEAYEEEKV